MTEAAGKGIRLNRYLAMCGVAARRKAEEYIASGRIKINGLTVTEPGRQVLPDDTVEFDGIKVLPERRSASQRWSPRPWRTPGSGQ